MSDNDLAKLLLLREADLFNASKDELEAYEEITGRTLPERASRIRSLLDGALKDYRKSLLVESRRRLDAASAPSRSNIDFSKFRDKKGFLQSLLEKFPSISPALTFQNRDLEGLSEDDVEVALKQLEELGVIKEFLDKNENT